MRVTCDFLVIGSGIAGLTLALDAAEHGEVIVVTKRALDESNTKYAQGGIAAVLSPEDSFASHVEDTLVAGAGLNHPRAVEVCVTEGPAQIRALQTRGARFDQAPSDAHADESAPDLTRAADAPGLDLHLEGGHAARRIVHAGDMTGREVERALVESVRANPRIQVLEHHMAIDLITLSKFGGPEVCAGAYALDVEAGKVRTILARATVLATGGAGKVYLYTSNPDVATGDGVAMAYRAGAGMANLEFYQFHPTCLYHPKAKSFLITEAIRGEGGRLLLPDGERFMTRFDARGELAPRDVVARAIDHEMKRLGADCVFLDISHQSLDFLQSHFPTVMARCLEFGIDISAEPIPVVPAAHYTCGGVVVDTRGRTDLAGLYAIGETSFTGLHGANRMASNSLLECIVYAESAARHIAQTLQQTRAPDAAPPWDESQVTDSDEDVVISHNWDELRRFMWDYVGIVRTDKRLQRAQHRVQLLQAEIAEYYGNYKVSNDLLELRNLAMVAQLMIQCAISRKESRGLHFTLDYPDQLPEAKNTVLRPDNSPLQ